MSILPRVERLFDRLPKHNEIIKRSAACIVIAANRCLRQITMTMTERMIALAIQLRVLGIRKPSGMQAVRSIEWHLQPKKNGSVIPYFREKIVPLMQTDTVQRHRVFYASVDIFRQALGRYRTIL